MIEDCGSQARCSHDLSRDYGTLCDEFCSVVTTIVFHGRNYDPKEMIEDWQSRLSVVATMVATMTPCF